MESERAMSVKIKVDIPSDKILRVRGLGGSKDAQRVLASTVVRLADKYVPMSSGAGAHMKNQTQIAQDGSYILYGGGGFPYVHYHFLGEKMAGRAPKKYTGENMNYHGGPMRGPNWIARMMADKSREVTATVEIYIKRKGGLTL